MKVPGICRVLPRLSYHLSSTYWVGRYYSHFAKEVTEAQRGEVT